VKFIWIVLWLLVGLWAAALRKQRSFWGVLLHALLGPFGILLFALIPEKKKPAPPQANEETHDTSKAEGPAEEEKGKEG
jgi:hypothetical protein